MKSWFESPLARQHRGLDLKSIWLRKQDSNLQPFRLTAERKRMPEYWPFRATFDAPAVN